MRDYYDRYKHQQKRSGRKAHPGQRRDGGSVSASVFDGRLHCGSSIRHYLSGGGELCFGRYSAGGRHFVFLCCRADSVCGFKGAETERGAGFNPVRSILWHLNRPGLFLCKPVCYGGESGSAACGSFTIQLRSGNSGFAGGRSGDDIRQKNFVKSHDLEQ